MSGVGFLGRRMAVAAALVCVSACGQVLLWTSGPTSAVGFPGGSYGFLMTASNVGQTPQTLSAWANDGVLTGDPSGSTMLPGETITFGLDVTLSATEIPGTTRTPFVSLSTSGGGFESVGFVVDVELPAPTLAVWQPGGPGALTAVSGYGLYAPYEYRAVFSLELAPAGLGSGPYLGLFASDPSTLVAQLLVPAGTHPFSFTGAATDGSLGVSLGAYPLPTGLTFETVVLYPRLFVVPGAAPFQWTGAQSFTAL